MQWNLAIQLVEVAWGLFVLLIVSIVGYTWIIHSEYSACSVEQFPIDRNLSILDTHSIDRSILFFRLIYEIHTTLYSSNFLKTLWPYFENIIDYNSL